MSTTVHHKLAIRFLHTPFPPGHTEFNQIRIDFFKADFWGREKKEKNKKIRIVPQSILECFQYQKKL